jgi:hypothetical protein
MILSQRYPTAFNGIVSGDPAMRTGLSNLAIGQWIPVAYNQAAPKDTSGKPQIDKFLTDSDRTLFMDALMKRCDAKDGVADGMISDPLGCDFDPAVLACKPGQKEACIAPEKISAIKKAFAGPKNAYGTQVYPGFLYDGGIAMKGFVSGLLAMGPSGIFGPYTSATEIDVDQLALHASDPLVEPASTNLTTFSLSGVSSSSSTATAIRGSHRLTRLTITNPLPQPTGVQTRLPSGAECFLSRAWPIAAVGPLSITSTCFRRRRLGREGDGARFHYRHRSGIPRPQPPALRLPKARAVQRKR